MTTDAAPTDRTAGDPTGADSDEAPAFWRHLLLYGLLLVLPLLEILDSGTVSVTGLAVGAVLFGGLGALFEWTSLGRRLRSEQTTIETGNRLVLAALVLAGFVAVGFLFVLVWLTITSLLDVSVPFPVPSLTVPWASLYLGGVLATLGLDLYTNRT